jgi:hypothetical protein
MDLVDGGTYLYPLRLGKAVPRWDAVHSQAIPASPMRIHGMDASVSTTPPALRPPHELPSPGRRIVLKAVISGYLQKPCDENAPASQTAAVVVPPRDKRDEYYREHENPEPEEATVPRKTWALVPQALIGSFTTLAGRVGYFPVWR